MEKKNIQPVQMIGTQRSGSNMLRLMLNQFDEISAPHPPHILQRFFPVLHLYGNLQENENFFSLVDDVCRLVEYNPVPWKGVDLNRSEIISRCNNMSLTEIFRVIYDLKAESENAKIWVCKSMANVKNASDFEESGMNMRYIYLYRDGRDVACSFKKAIVGEKHVYHIANQWNEDQQDCIELEKLIDPSRFLKISYEDLLHQPETEMKRISAFLNIPFKREVFDFYKSEESKNTAVAGKMWENVSRPILTNNTNKYKRELTPYEIAVFEKQAGMSLQQLGYRLDANAILNGAPFSESELRTFHSENKRLKEIALEIADPEGMKLREKQDNLFREIKEKYAVSVSF